MIYVKNHVQHLKSKSTYKVLTYYINWFCNLLVKSIWKN